MPSSQTGEPLPPVTPDLIQAFASQGTPRGVFTEAEIFKLIEGSDWLGRFIASRERLISSLVQHTKLERISVQSQQRSTPTVRYTWGRVSSLAIALSLARPTAYLSHATAAALHRLIPMGEPIYINQEQTPKPKSAGPLTQEAIARAFRSPQRTSNNRHRWAGGAAVILNGKFTNALAVQDVNSTDAGTVRATSVERTLLDIAVRPAYCGGPTGVLVTFKAARSTISVSRLRETLDLLGYVYPYQQSIGFYMERTGWSSGDVAEFRRTPFEFDFYLDYALQRPSYDPNWRIYYPASFDENR